MSERDRQSQMEKKQQQQEALGCLPACQPACLKEPHFMTLSRSHRFFLCKELLPCMAPSRSLAPILHLCNSLLAVNNRNRLGLVAIKICLHRLSFAPCCTDRTGGEWRGESKATAGQTPARTVQLTPADNKICESLPC